jgi:hypothetical protein
MASSHGTDRVSARCDLADNPGLVLIAPCPPPLGTGKHLQPAHWLRDSTMFSVHSKPNGQNHTAVRLADHDIIRKVVPGHRLRITPEIPRTEGDQVGQVASYSSVNFGHGLFCKKAGGIESLRDPFRSGQNK